jgi:RNA polymerase sigma-70 factor, ECF subfamily
MHSNDLLRLVRQGDDLAWEAFVRAHQGRVFGLAYHYTTHAEDARDLAQDVFVRIYQHLDRIPDSEGLVPWLVRITRNACIDFLRRRKARPPGWDLPVEVFSDLKDTAPDPLAAHEARRRSEGLHRALRELSNLNREMILLKEIQGLALEEIARLLEVPLGTVKSRSNRARLELADKLAAAGWGD